MITSVYAEPPTKGIKLFQLPTELFPSPKWSDSVTTQIPLARYRSRGPFQLDHRRSNRCATRGRRIGDVYTPAAHGESGAAFDLDDGG
ncbi:unnamed protein product [Rhizoctonia solani]|uniref:Uncharacterized protein n=1 Tax=Rhizoctonia solani TaxID=456999 RepID=A0A8H3H6X9_9AGAM|nr:unnamed protein product [Rhizoctonia solani]